MKDASFLKFTGRSSKAWKNRSARFPILGSVALVAGAAGILMAGTADQLDAETAARIEKAEKGPAVIDVSKYPAPVQESYKLFAQKCSQCHKLSRPINSDYALPDEWSRYVKRMMHKPDSNLDKDEAKQIYEFLSYDSSIRKKALVDEKLAKASPEEKAAAEKKIAELRAKFDK
ncbi:MAG: hypothetical protein EPN23_07820 [Verrucomicrobia bacterium]|nr:MAG: hypothetical protein EPN23_07820 [Verrucomicrobiota bacterium]